MHFMYRCSDGGALLMGIHLRRNGNPYGKSHIHKWTVPLMIDHGLGEASVQT